MRFFGIHLITILQRVAKLLVVIWSLKSILLYICHILSVLYMLKTAAKHRQSMHRDRMFILSKWFSFHTVNWDHNAATVILKKSTAHEHDVYDDHYVFSLFPPRPPRPPPQRLLPLTSKSCMPKLTYLGQRIYRSGEIYWMTFLWPWPKVTAVALVKRKCLSARYRLQKKN